MQNSVMQAILGRRSCRSFAQDKAVREQDLLAVLEAGAYAPSAMNTQSWHFTAVTNGQKLQELNAAMLSRMDDAARARAAGRAGDRPVSPFYNAPVMILVSLKNGGSPYPEADCACALENMFLAAASLGLGTCWINQLRGATTADPHAGEVLRALGVPDGYTIHGCCALGYADKKSPAKERAAGVVNIVK